jgi:hypothetical protein
MGHLFFFDLNVSNMPSSDGIFANWRGIIDDDLFATIRTAFELPSQDHYVYRAESFEMTLAQIEEHVNTGKLKWNYQAHGQGIEVNSAL